jgi:hypothetical protein
MAVSGQCLLAASGLIPMAAHIEPAYRLALAYRERDGSTALGRLPVAVATIGSHLPWRQWGQLEPLGRAG